MNLAQSGLEKIIVKELSKIRLPIVLISDASIFSDYYEILLEKTNINFEKFRLVDIPDLHSLLKDNSKFLLFSFFKLRILNVNFDRIEKLPIGEPYYVVSESNLETIIRQSRPKNCILNPLVEFPEATYNYLFKCEPILTWLKNVRSDQPHNDRLDRELVSSCVGLQKQQNSELYKGDFDRLESSFEKTIVQKLGLADKIIYFSTPLHRYIKIKLKIETNYNQEIRNIYGNVD